MKSIFVNIFRATLVKSLVIFVGIILLIPQELWGMNTEKIKENFIGTSFSFGVGAEYTMPILQELLEVDELLPLKKVQAIIGMANLQRIELLDFYYQNLEQICAKSTLKKEDYWMLSPLLEAIVFVDKNPDVELVVKGLNYYVVKKKPFQQYDYNIESWWGAVVATIYLGETGDIKYLQILNDLQTNVVRLAKSNYKDPDHLCGRTPRAEWDMAYFASGYAKRRLGGENPLEILLDIFDTTKYQSERLFCMNLIRYFTGIIKPYEEGQIHQFPFKFEECQQKYYLSKRRRALSKIGYGREPYKIYPPLVVLSDGSHPTGPMSEEEVTNEIMKIKRIVIPQQQEAWEKLKTTLKVASGVTVMSILQEYRYEIVKDDYRLIMPRYSED